MLGRAEEHRPHPHEWLTAGSKVWPEVLGVFGAVPWYLSVLLLKQHLLHTPHTEQRLHEVLPGDVHETKLLHFVSAPSFADMHTPASSRGPKEKHDPRSDVQSLYSCLFLPSFLAGPAVRFALDGFFLGTSAFPPSAWAPSSTSSSSASSSSSWSPSSTPTKSVRRRCHHACTLS